MTRKLIFLTLASLCIYAAHATVYVVSNTGNAGTGTLRYALTMCAATPGPHTIEFNIPITDAGYNHQTGVWVIRPQSTLPTIMRSCVTIDGCTQTGNVGNTNPYGPEIVIDGDSAIDYGFRFMNAEQSAIRGLNIRRFTEGVQFYNSPRSSVMECYIGVDELGETAKGNKIGLEFISGSDSCTIGNGDGGGNLISGNAHIGIRLLDVQYCTVAGNLIGTNRLGTVAVPNADGMSMEGAVQFCTIGGTDVADRNIISGNLDYGLPIFGVGATGNRVIGNFIGTDISGTYAIGNTYGVLCDDGSYANIIGGQTAAERNIISGNVGYGVFLYNNGTKNNLLKNNYIGTDHTGVSAIPNTCGIIIDGISYSNIIDSNIISGNLQSGIGINISGSDSNVIVRNRIGVNVNDEPLPNGMDGIRISQGVKATQIGGSISEANIIANNGGCGVYVTNDDCTANRISCNTFYNNGGLAIDLFLPGVTPNDNGDGDDGANRLINFPVIEMVQPYGDNHGLKVSGSIDTPQPENVEIQIYRASIDPTGYGEGCSYVASVTPDDEGNWSATVAGLSPDDHVTALAIDTEGNTSEFSLSRNRNGIPSVGVGARPTPLLPLRLMPNPAVGWVDIVAPDGTYTEALLTSVSGKIVNKVKIKGGHTLLDMSSLPSGVYVFTASGVAYSIVKQ